MVPLPTLLVGDSLASNEQRQLTLLHRQGAGQSHSAFTLFADDAKVTNFISSLPFDLLISMSEGT